MVTVNKEIHKKIVKTIQNHLKINTKNSRQNNLISRSSPERAYKNFFTSSLTDLFAFSVVFGQYVRSPGQF